MVNAGLLQTKAQKKKIELNEQRREKKAPGKAQGRKKSLPIKKDSGAQLRNGER